MPLHQTQRCVSDQPFAVFEIPSRSVPGKVYSVYSVDPEDPPDQYICHCEGYCYRGTCSHQMDAFEDRCLWNELAGPEQQTAGERESLTCPRCKGETYKQTEWFDE